MPTTERTLTAPITGPVCLDLTMPSGVIDVTVADTDRAQITLTTDDPADGTAARAISEASARTDVRVMTVHVPTPAAGQHGTTIINTGTGRTVITGTAAAGVVIIGGNNHGNVFSGGQVISGGILTYVIRAAITLPCGSALRVGTKTGMVTTNGELEWVEFSSLSGGLNVDTCVRLDARSTSGSICAKVADHATVRTVSGDIDLQRSDAVTATSSSGDIRVDNFAGSAQVSTVSGDIDIHVCEPGQVAASSSSGDVTVTAPAELAASPDLSVQARSLSGRVRIPQPPVSPHRPRRPRRTF
ncbi:DUF4097 family beta strand repeat-containing protein [Herbidospora cretacea]|uniref:DUF4097 family beta strand repeat-containing protein n=1 Tax=Herbidospora cretacea TaxID=28444 RepID=UPI000AA26D0D|nr:DUF4097 family beta strand repeat-containing protein [Herbidospora cretacea]